MTTVSSESLFSIADDLIAHHNQTGVPLPMQPMYIALLESYGLIVDLVTGEITADPDAAVALSEYPSFYPPGDVAAVTALIDIRLRKRKDDKRPALTA